MGPLPMGQLNLVTARAVVNAGRGRRSGPGLILTPRSRPASGGSAAVVRLDGGGGEGVKTQIFDRRAILSEV